MKSLLLLGGCLLDWGRGGWRGEKGGKYWTGALLLAWFDHRDGGVANCFQPRAPRCRRPSCPKSTASGCRAATAWSTSSPCTSPRWAYPVRRSHRRMPDWYTHTHTHTDTGLDALTHAHTPTHRHIQTHARGSMDTKSPQLLRIRRWSAAERGGDAWWMSHADLCGSLRRDSGDSVDFRLVWADYPAILHASLKKNKPAKPELALL